VGRAEAWAGAHKGLIGLIAAAAAALGALLLLLHPKGRQAAQSMISYVPAPFTQQPQASVPMSNSGSTDSVTGWTATLTKRAFPGFGQVPLFASPATAWQGLIAGWQDPNQPIMLTGRTQAGPAGEDSPASTIWYETVGGLWVNADQVVNMQPIQGPTIGIKSQLSNVPQSSAVMSGVG
jgi:hypothetical protein